MEHWRRSGAWRRHRAGVYGRSIRPRFPRLAAVATAGVRHGLSDRYFDGQRRDLEGMHPMLTYGVTAAG